MPRSPAIHPTPQPEAISANLIEPAHLRYTRGGLKCLHRITFDETAEWIVQAGGTANLALDQTNVKAAGSADSNQLPTYPASALSVTKTNTNGTSVKIRYTLPASIDVTDMKVLAARYYLPTGTGDSLWSRLANIYLYLSDNTSRRYWKIYEAGQTEDGPGWHTWSGHYDNYYGQTGGTLNKAAVTYVEIDIQVSAATYVPAVVFDMLGLYAAPTWLPKVVLTDDDGTIGATSVMDFVSALNSRTLRNTRRYPYGHLMGSFQLVSGNVGKSGRWNLSQLRQTYDAGHEINIQNYTESESSGADGHPRSWKFAADGVTPITLAQKKQIVQLVRQYLYDLGLFGGDRVLSTSGGYTGSMLDDQALLDEGYIDLIRYAGGTPGGVQYMGGASNNRPVQLHTGFDPRTITSLLVDPTGAAGFMDDDLVDALGLLQTWGGGILCVHSHSGGIANCPNFLDAVQAAVNAGTVENCTLSEIAEMRGGMGLLTASPATPSPSPRSRFETGR